MAAFSDAQAAEQTTSKTLNQTASEQPAPQQADEQFRPLFDGRSLDGWIPVNTAESTWTIRDGMLICSGKPIGELRTRRMYQNFILELEWRHMKPKGNAGVFVWADDITARGKPFHRSIEVQVLENAYGNGGGHTTHGDIFPIHGATMEPINGRGGKRAFPTEHRSRPSPEWNHYRIVCNAGEVSLAVNGKVVTRGRECSPSKGYICLESEGGVVHYRNVRIRELPDTPLSPEHVAIADRGYRCLYNGLDLKSWQVEGNWQPSDWQLRHTSASDGKIVYTQKLPEDVELLLDVKLRKPSSELTLELAGHRYVVTGNDKRLSARWLAGEWNRLRIDRKDGAPQLYVNGYVAGSIEPATTPQKGLGLHARGGLELSNIFVRPR